tara:strand:+ start:28 stop:480 length:453 start_codon:yes stop_codon:yes gene_type:complete
MNNLLLLVGFVLVVCLMNSKDLMNSDLVKSVSSKSKSVSKSLGVDNSTLLVVVFVGVVLFMCMSKGVEGFTGLENGECPNGKKMHAYDPSTKPSIAGYPKKHTPVCFSNNTEVSVFTKIKEGLDKVINNPPPVEPVEPVESDNINKNNDV